MNSKLLRLLIILTVIVTVTSGHGLRAQMFGEAAYNFLRDYPGDASPGWETEAQGLAHDDENWFITQRYDIWKIPVANDITEYPADGVRGVVKRNIGEFSSLVRAGFNHFGDPELFTWRGEGYLFIPVVAYGACGDPPRPGCRSPQAMAVFRGRDLSLISIQYVTLGKSGEDVSGESWCAFDTNGNLYVPNHAWDKNNEHESLTLTKYTCDFVALIEDRPALAPESTIHLLDEAGMPVDVDWGHQQGGAISPSGGLLYISTGMEDEERLGTDGIHVFDLSTLRRVKRSTKDSRPFIYQFDNDDKWQEPEGLTFWDLEDGRSPGIRGQLHVMMVAHGAWDTVFVKHYTSAVYVNHAASSAEHGIPEYPFNTVLEGNDYAWNGADLRIKTGSYPETLTFSKRMRIIADGGPVTIGR